MARKTVHTPIKGADGKETLEERRLRQLVEKDADARVKRLEGIKLAEAKKVQASTQVKMPVTLTSVYETFLKRIKACPVKVMRSEEKDQFGRAPRVTKIEARFLDMPQGNVMQSLKGLDIRAPVTKVRDMSYTHCGLWGHKGSVIQFRVSMYRYKDKSVLFIFSPD